MTTRANATVNKIAIANRTQSIRSKKVNLPKIEDLKQLNYQLECKLRQCVSILQKDFNYQMWVTLSKVVLTKIMIYNRKRPGDVEKSQVVEFNNLEAIDTDTLNTLSEEEKNVGTKYKRYITRGKLNSPTSVLVTETKICAIQLVFKYRTQTGVGKTNSYVFARPASSSNPFFSTGLALKKFCNIFGLDKRNLSATNLRKHLATRTSNLDQNQQQLISDFMGHDFKIHNRIYVKKPASKDI